MSWIAAAGLAIGAGTSIYGANKQDKANKAAQAQNQAQQEEQNRLAWANYLMQRGIDPSAATQTGVIPQNARAVNTRLPLWAVKRRPASSPQAVASAQTRPAGFNGLW